MLEGELFTVSLVENPKRNGGFGGHLRAELQWSPPNRNLLEENF